MNKPLLKNQRGVAMFIVMMMLSVGSTFALLAFQVSSTELAIARNAEDEISAQYVAESGVEKVLSWATVPNQSPHPAFFAALPEQQCTGNRENPDFPDTSSPGDDDSLKYLDDRGPFSALADSGKIVDLRLYAPTHIDDGICTIEVTAITPTGAAARVQVNIGLNPLGNLTAGIQGAGNPENPSPVWVHWGHIRYVGNTDLGTDILKTPRLDPAAFPTGEPFSLRREDPMMTLRVQKKILNPPTDNGDSYVVRSNITQHNGAGIVLDTIHSKRLQSFIKKHGAYYTVSPDGQHLLQDGHHIVDDDGRHIDSFDHIFNGKTTKSHLIWIENNGAPPLKISGEKFKGYFYFSGAIVVEGGTPGRSVNALSPPVTSYPDGLEVTLSNINLEGTFITKDTITLLNRFTAYGALYAANGFKGKGASDLEVWYNARLAKSIYPGVRTVTPLIGTWASVPINGS